MFGGDVDSEWSGVDGDCVDEEDGAAVACEDETQSCGASGRGEQFMMAGQGRSTAWNSFRHEDWR